MRPEPPPREEFQETLLRPQVPRRMDLQEQQTKSSHQVIIQ